MKIAMIGHKRIPSREGGVELVVETLATRMAALGHNVIVYNRSGHNVSGKENDSYNYQKKYDYNGVQCITIPTPQNKSLNAIVYSFFATFCASFRSLDVIHFHAEGPCSMIPIAKCFRKRCIATIHGLDWQRSKWGGFATKFLLFGEKMAAKYADEVIVLSKGVQDYFKKTYNRDTIFIPNGIEKKEYQKAQIITDKYGIKKDGYLLFLARLVPEKGVHTLIEAYGKSGIKIPLVIAGGSSHSSEYEDKIKSMAKEFNVKGAGKIILTGFVQGRELEELFSNGLLYILPSEIEGMPLSLLEAMSYGCLCLTSDIPENTDVYETHGMSFQTGNVDELRKSLCQIVDNFDTIRNQTQYRKEEIQKFVTQKYNWDTIVKRTLKLYEGIDSQ